MSDTLATGVSGGAAELPPTPATTRYLELARQISGMLNEIAALIPAFEPKHRATAKFVQSFSRYPNDFIATVLAAVEADPQLQNVKKFDVVDARDTFQYMEAFRPLVDQLTVLRDNVKFSCDTRKARAVADGLQLYDIAKGLGRDPGSASVATLTEIMKRDLNRPGRRKKSKEVPQPQTTTTVQ